MKNILTIIVFFIFLSLCSSEFYTQSIKPAMNENNSILAIIGENNIVEESPEKAPVKIDSSNFIFEDAF